MSTGGVSIGKLLTGTIPDPIHDLIWGEDIPEAVMRDLRNGETALLHDEAGKPYSHVLIDGFGTIRERRLAR